MVSVGDLLRVGFRGDTFRLLRVRLARSSCLCADSDASMSASKTGPRNQNHVLPSALPSGPLDRKHAGQIVDNTGTFSGGQHLRLQRKSHHAERSPFRSSNVNATTRHLLRLTRPTQTVVKRNNCRHMGYSPCLPLPTNHRDTSTTSPPYLAPIQLAIAVLSSSSDIPVTRALQHDHRVACFRIQCVAHRTYDFPVFQI